MQLMENILNQFINPQGANKELVELKLQKITKQLLEFLSDAGNKPTYPEFIHFETKHFEIPTEPKSENQISSRLQEFFNLSMNLLNKIAEIAKQNDLWLHIDAIYGGADIFYQKHKYLINFYKIYSHPLLAVNFDDSPFLQNETSLQFVERIISSCDYIYTIRPTDYPDLIIGDCALNQISYGN